MSTANAYDSWDEDDEWTAPVTRTRTAQFGEQRHTSRQADELQHMYGNEPQHTANPSSYVDDGCVTFRPLPPGRLSIYQVAGLMVSTTLGPLPLLMPRVYARLGGPHWFVPLALLTAVLSWSAHIVIAMCGRYVGAKSWPSLASATFPHVLRLHYVGELLASTMVILLSVARVATGFIVLADLLLDVCLPLKAAPTRTLRLVSLGAISVFWVLGPIVLRPLFMAHVWSRLCARRHPPRARASSVGSGSDSSADSATFMLLDQRTDNDSGFGTAGASSAPALAERLPAQLCLLLWPLALAMLLIRLRVLSYEDSEPAPGNATHVAHLAQNLTLLFTGSSAASLAYPSHALFASDSLGAANTTGIAHLAAPHPSDPPSFWISISILVFGLASQDNIFPYLTSLSRSSAGAGIMANRFAITPTGDGSDRPARITKRHQWPRAAFLGTAGLLAVLFIWGVFGYPVVGEYRDDLYIASVKCLMALAIAGTLEQGLCLLQGKFLRVLCRAGMSAETLWLRTVYLWRRITNSSRPRRPKRNASMREDAGTGDGPEETRSGNDEPGQDGGEPLGHSHKGGKSARRRHRSVNLHVDRTNTSPSESPSSSEEPALPSPVPQSTLAFGARSSGRVSPFDTSQQHTTVIPPFENSTNDTENLTSVDWELNEIEAVESGRLELVPESDSEDNTDAQNEWEEDFYSEDEVAGDEEEETGLAALMSRTRRNHTHAKGLRILFGNWLTGWRAVVVRVWTCGVVCVVSGLATLLFYPDDDDTAAEAVALSFSEFAGCTLSIVNMCIGPALIFIILFHLRRPRSIFVSDPDDPHAAADTLLMRKERQVQRRLSGRRVWQDLVVFGGLIPYGVVVLVRGVIGFFS